MLVYEYMNNGSLEKWIFSENQEAALSWNMKKKIVLGHSKRV